MRENKMKIRKLDQSEHGKTRSLWEQVFSEDSQEFVDYYYYIKTKDNTIYVIEEGDKIRAMLQLNPYQVKLQESVVPSDYIVGVATQAEYRGRGYMKSSDSCITGSVFTEDAIYLPDAGGRSNLLSL